MREWNDLDRLSALDNKSLLLELQNLVSEERRLLTQILEYLHEVAQRKLFLDMGYPSLFEFCTRELGYSEGAAQRRISAMRLLAQIPELEAKIESGELSLSVIAQAQTFFKKQERDQCGYSVGEKRKLLDKLKGASSRQCERALVEIDPGFVRVDRERPVTEDLTELRLTVKSEFLAQVEELKDLVSHAMPGATTKDILVAAVAEMLARVKKEKMGDGVTEGSRKVESLIEVDVAQAEGKGKGNTSAPPVLGELPPMSAARDAPNIKSRYISRQIRREVWRRAEGKCCYVDAASGRRCGSRRFLEIDHIVAYSRGGSNEASNLTLLCDGHNRRKGSGSLPSSAIGPP